MFSRLLSTLAIIGCDQGLLTTPGFFIPVILYSERKCNPAMHTERDRSRLRSEWFKIFLRLCLIVANVIVVVRIMRWYLRCIYVMCLWIELNELTIVYDYVYILGMYYHSRFHIIIPWYCHMTQIFVL